MSLMKTLAKVAIGVALAKGAKSMMSKRSQTRTADNNGGLGGLLGGLVQNPGSAQRHGGAHSPGGGLEDMLGGLLGGKTTAGGAQGGLGGLLEQLGGAKTSGAGGLGGLLGGLASATSTGRGAGDLLAGTDETLRRRPERENADFGSVLNSQFGGEDEQIEPSQDQEAAAALMLAAMIQAAKSDGTFDEDEKAKLLDQLGDVDAEEAAFVRRQMQAPVDVDALVRQTPQGMGPQIYAMSLLGIDLDTQDEAQYLHKLAQAYGMAPAEVNRLHEDMGMPTLYA